ncbi:MAG TPA: hypothetical protein VMU19_07265 [Bryobacteraceae bacterium]|nr:hypothetical protein [Bryobacteraceae bacterium]
MHARMREAPLAACVLLLTLCLAETARAQLAAAMAEPDLEKRSGLALENASEALKAAQKAYDSDEDAKVKALGEEIVASVDLAAASLDQTGKDPRSHPKWFKRAEISTRDLLHRLEDFQAKMSYMDRGLLDPVKAQVQKVHDRLLLGLMEGKPK